MANKRHVKSKAELITDRAVLEAKQKAKLAEQEAMEDDLPEDALIAKEAIESAEKNYDDDMVPAQNEIVSASGPRSWEELDTARDTAEKAATVSLASLDLRNLVSNILYDYGMPMEDKVKALQDVTGSFGDRIQGILDEPEDDEATEEVEVKEISDPDYWLAFSTLEKDRRDNGAVGTIFDNIVDKAKLTTSGRKALSTDQFALPSKKKYPIHDKAHVRNALSRAAAEIKAGGPGAADAKAALPKIHAAAKKMGIGMAKKEKGGILIEKDKTGQWRWVGWPSNNFIDSDGDIFTEIAHKEYVSFLDKNPSLAPSFFSWHTPETARKSPVDFWAYNNGFLIMSGPLEEPEAVALLKAKADDDLGMSHGALIYDRDENDRRQVLQYRMYEVSDLPLSHASNAFTNVDIALKEAGMKIDEKVNYLAQFVGKEKATEYVNEQTAAAQSVLKQAGIEQKEKTDPAPAAPALPKEDAHVMELIEKAIAEKVNPDGLQETLQAIYKEVAEGKEAKEKVAVLEATVKELAKGEDQRLADKIVPPMARSWSLVQKSAGKDGDNTIEDDDELLNGPSLPGSGDGWLSAATGTAPVPTPAV